MTNVQEKIEAANQLVCKRMIEAQPILIDVRKSLDVVPGMLPNMILHSGPPITWDRMGQPQKNGILGAILFEGLVRDPKEVEDAIRSGEILLAPCHEHSTVGSMAGVTSASMQVFVVKNQVQNNISFHQIFEPGENMFTFGICNKKVLEDYHCMNGPWAQAMAAGVRASGGINLRNIIARALTMGDECHNRCGAGTYQFTLELIHAMTEAGVDNKMLRLFARTGMEHPISFLFLNMAAAKNIADAGHGINYSTVVTAMCRNGVDFGIRVSGLGDRWFTAPAPEIEGLYFSSQWGKADASPDMGDSSITETIGLGAFVMSNAPALLQTVGSTLEDARGYTKEMYEITVTKNPNFLLPVWGFQGAPLGIDIRKVVQTNLTPIIDTGIAAKKGGFIGIGLCRAPVEAFQKALSAFGEQYLGNADSQKG